MYLPFKNGTVDTIQGLDCQVPPKGWIYNPLLSVGGKLKGGMEHIGIYARSTQSKHCFWERDPRWSKYEEWHREEVKMQKSNKGYKHPKLAEFIADCWRWRLGGMWISNNGKPVYITGNHWFYLSCIWLETGMYPKFRDTDRQFFYFKEFVWEHPLLLGIIEATKRRYGKSYKGGGGIALHHGTMEVGYRAGFQSKTDDDGKDLFKKVILEPFRKLPYFFRPDTNMPQSGKMPAGNLEFRKGSLGGADHELGGMIDYRSSKEGAYDGQLLRYYFGDEEGKESPADIFDRWERVRLCLVNGEMEVIGKALHTSTVEDIEKEGQAFFKLWESSNHYETEDLLTSSGLVKYFLPADHARILDDYGYPKVAESRAAILAERARCRTTYELMSRKRKEPLDEAEMFLSSAQDCVYNVEVINSRIDAMKYGVDKRPVRRGNFIWKDRVDGEVFFVDDPNGRFHMAYDPPPEYRNRVAMAHDGSFKPELSKVARMFGAGVDPIEHRWVTKSSHGRRSDPAISIVKAENAILPSDVDGGEACWYHTRPDIPETFYEDTIKVLRYYGCGATIERQKEGVIRHMYDRGYGGFVTKMKGQDVPGIPAGVGTTNAIMTHTETYIATLIEATYNMRLLEEWLKFDPTNTKPFDCAMAFGNALLEIKGFIADGKFSGPQRERPMRKLSDILPY